jgi:hypothetical protein
MTDFYRRTKIEELEQRHPGLLDFVNKSIRERVPYPEIAAAVLEQWDEEVSPQVLSNHKNLRVWKQVDAETESYVESLGQGRALLQMQKESPTTEREELIEAFVDVGIIAQKKRLMESDPLKLMAERRKRIELEQRGQEIEIEKGKLAVALKDSETARIKAEAELARVKSQRKLEQDAVEGVVRDPKVTREQVAQKIRNIFGVSDPVPTAASAPAAEVVNG